MIRLHRRSRRRCHGPRPVPAVRGPHPMRSLLMDANPLPALHRYKPVAPGASQQETDTRTSNVCRPVPAAQKTLVLELWNKCWNMPPFSADDTWESLNEQLHQCRGRKQHWFCGTPREASPGCEPHGPKHVFRAVFGCSAVGNNAEKEIPVGRYFAKPPRERKRRR